MNMVQKLTIAPRYNSFYVAGRRVVSPPEDLDYAGLAASPQCVTVPTLYWNEGDTSVVLGRYGEVGGPGDPNFDGLLQTPERRLMLSEANDVGLAAAVVPTTETRVRIWLDHPTEPSHVIIAWG